MTNLLVRLFVKDSGDVKIPRVRAAYGRLAGAVGIASNLLLFVLKITVGTLSGSIAILADATNNLSDCASSVITLVGFKMAAMPPDEEHPYGHARIEYISGLVVSFLILAIGLEFFLSSLRKAISPEPVTFSGAMALILLASIGVKLWQAMFNRSVGARISSDALRATAMDSLNDVIATTVVLIGALVGRFTGLLLDGWMGMLVAVFVLVSGVRLVRDALNPLLGAAPDAAMLERLREKILEYPSVIGVHDLIVHSYGPGRCYATAHVEVPATLDVMTSHAIVDNIECDVLKEMDVALVAHMDPVIIGDEQVNQYSMKLQKIVEGIDPALSFHDFRVVEGEARTVLIFDVAVPPRYRLSDCALRGEIAGGVCNEIGEKIDCAITIDRSYTATRQ